MKGATAMKRRNSNSRELLVKRIAHERSRQAYRKEVARLIAVVRSAWQTGQKPDELLAAEWKAALQDNLPE